MACISKRRGVYVVDYRDALGDRHTPSFKTKSAAQDELARVLAEVGGPRRAPEDRNITVTDYAVRWLKLIKAVIKPRTLESYEASLRLHVLPALGHRKVRDVGRNHVKALVAQLHDGGLSKNTVRIVHASLHALLNEAVEDDIIVVNPASRRGKSKLLRLAPTRGERENIKAFDRDQLVRFLKAAHEKTRHSPMFFTMARTGIRLGEAFGLQWQDVDFTGREIQIARAISGGRIETPKSGKSRSVDMSPALRDVLQRHDAETKAAALKVGRERPAWVFPSIDGMPLDRANVEKAFKRVLKHAGLPLYFTPHSLRHSYASLLLADEVSVAYVQEQLGHSSIKMTVDTYGRWLRKKAPGAVDRLDDAPGEASGSGGSSWRVSPRTASASY